MTSGLEILPGIPIGDRAYAGHGDPVLLSNARKLRAGSTQCENSPCLRLSDFCGPGAFTAWWVAAPLPSFVGHVIRLRSKKKVRWVATRPVIASMQNGNFGSNLIAESNSPRDTVGVFLPPLI